MLASLVARSSLTHTVAGEPMVGVPSLARTPPRLTDRVSSCTFRLLPWVHTVVSVLYMPLSMPLHLFHVCISMLVMILSSLEPESIPASCNDVPSSIPQPVALRLASFKPLHGCMLLFGMTSPLPYSILSRLMVSLAVSQAVWQYRPSNLVLSSL